MLSARQLVLELLIKMDTKGSYSNLILDHTFNSQMLNGRDKAFATVLFYGVLERRMTLDYIIRCYSKTEFDSIATENVEILRMGIYQLLYMDSVPENAAVNESVSLAKKSVKGFINAILRSFVRDGLEIDYKELEGIARLSIEYSCPKWLIKKWIGQFGEEKTIGILKASFGRPPLFIKVNTVKFSVEDVISELTREKIEVRRNKVFEDCLELGRVQGIESTNAYRKGMFHVQDISSQLCCHIARPGFNETVLDICSAPGGKSFTMAELMQNRGKVYSFDLYDGKISILNEGAKRLGLSIIIPQQNDGTVYNENIPMADTVLCDVVCSGLGVIRRKPEIKYKPMAELKELSPIQYQILDTSSRYVKAGGTLVYSTCTINAEENENVVERFLNEHKDFSPKIVPVDIEGIDNSSYCRNFLPSQTGGDGFFVATFGRKK